MRKRCARGFAMGIAQRLSRAVAATSLATVALIASAEEGGSGHYLPGSMASFIDGVPLEETFLTRLNVIHYKGSVGPLQPLPIGGVPTVGAAASSLAYGLTLLWRPPVDLGHAWSYAMSATIPLVDMNVTASITGPSGGGPTRSSSNTGLGDIVLMPLMLNYGVDPDFNVNFRVAAYAPSGGYEVGRLANSGKNFWTIEPTVGFMYFGQKNGIEVSAFAGLDFNSENKDTNYKSGNQFHVDGTLAQHFPMLGGLAGIGLSAYYYQQVTGDSGAGATFGAFKGKSVGFGPVVSFVDRIGGHDTVLELKWLHETETENRLKGDILWLKVVYKF